MAPSCTTPSSSTTVTDDLTHTRICPLLQLRLDEEESQRSANEKSDRHISSKTRHQSTRHCSETTLTTNNASPVSPSRASAEPEKNMASTENNLTIVQTDKGTTAPETENPVWNHPSDRINFEDCHVLESILTSKNNLKNNTVYPLDNNEIKTNVTKTSINPAGEVKHVKNVRANHRRNLSLDFRAMGIELPPLPELSLTLTTSPVRRLQNIPEGGAPNDAAPPAITPKIKHVVRRILSRRIN